MKTVGLWGEDIVLDSPKEKIINKSKKPKKVSTSKETLIKSKKLSISDKLTIINENVKNILGVYEDTTIVIKSKQELSDYIDKSIDNGIIAIDTETNNSLDPLTCKLMGLCLYTPGQNSAYIPVNHTDLQDNRFDWQVTEQDIKNELLRLDNVKIIMHNGKFDYKVIYCTCGVKLNIHWDTMIGAKILNENERSAGLKQQYIDKIDSSIEKYSIDKLFESIEYKYVQPEIFALYAATDSYMTYKLYEYQFNEFSCSNNLNLFNLFKTVEMPIVIISAEMELSGICIDFEYSSRLQKKYHLILDDINKKLDYELNKYSKDIELWRLTQEANFHPKSKTSNKLAKSKNEQLKNPPELTSTTQLSILLYDVLKINVIDKNNPRGTGEEILKQIDLPLVKLILEQRSILKLLNAFIDVLPKMVSKRDNRLHSNFNQLGTDTGRFSSTNPNLQQIPSKNREIRMMFRAAPGYKLVGADYSQQEPRLLAAYSRDTKMIEAYKSEKDLYATLGVGVYKNNYWDNMEHNEDGSPNEEGEKRRKKMKNLLLGMMYGMGPNLLANKMNCSLQEANKIISDFHKGFPELTNWMKETELNACKIGYVEDYWGRRRNLPDLLLPEYSIKSSSKIKDFNPLLNTTGEHKNTELINKYLKLLQENDRINYSSKSKQSIDAYNKIKEDALNEGIKISKNGGFISRAKRQCVNARIQGGAATMTKKAMIAIYNDEILKSYDFKLLIGIHDELIGECKEEFADECAERLVYLMKSCVPELNVPIKCDPTIEYNWNEEKYINGIRDEYVKHKDFNRLMHEHSECTKEQLINIIN